MLEEGIGQKQTSKKTQKPEISAMGNWILIQDLCTSAELHGYYWASVRARSMPCSGDLWNQTQKSFFYTEEWSCQLIHIFCNTPRYKEALTTLPGWFSCWLLPFDMENATA